MDSAAASRTQKSQRRPAQLPEEFVPLKFVGGGTIADVWQVRDRQSGQEYAIKMLKADWAERQVTGKLLENEAEVGRSAHSPFVVRTFSAELDHDPPFLVMEWLEGETLERELAQRQKFSYLEAVWVARQCVEGLEALREAGYTHGDIKPANIFRLPNGSVKLIDLGFARRCREVDGDQRPLMNVLTGTMEYLAPEILSSMPNHGTARDVYSLGITLFRMLSGRLPFQEEEPSDLLRSQLRSTPPNVRQFSPDVPRELEELLESMLAKQPIRRPQSLQRLIRAFVEIELKSLRRPAAA